LRRKRQGGGGRKAAESVDSRKEGCQSLRDKWGKPKKLKKEKNWTVGGKGRQTGNYLYTRMEGGGDCKKTKRKRITTRRGTGHKRVNTKKKTCLVSRNDQEGGKQDEITKEGSCKNQLKTYAGKKLKIIQNNRQKMGEKKPNGELVLFIKKQGKVTRGGSPES